RLRAARPPLDRLHDGEDPPTRGLLGSRSCGRRLLPVAGGLEARVRARRAAEVARRRAVVPPIHRLESPAVGEQCGEALRPLTQDLLALRLRELEPELRGQIEHDLLFE